LVGKPCGAQKLIGDLQDSENARSFAYCPENRSA
jgi:hypothetical protein